MSDSKERSCPFCSGLKIKYKTDDGIHWAECQTCFAEGPIGSKRSDDDEPRWEVRPTEDAAQSELAALREELAETDKENDHLLERASAAEQRNETLSNALIKIIEMNRQQAKDQYGDAGKAESWSCVTVAREALVVRNAED